MFVRNSLTILLAASGASAVLNELAKAAGKKYFGTATDNPELTDTQYTAILDDNTEWGQITPGNAMKWEYIEPEQNTYSYTEANQIADLAEANGQILRCHNLVWDSELPSWVTSDTWTNETLIAVIQAHIANEVGYYKGQCYAWDVVNEGLNDNGTFYSDVFYQVIGEAYIPIAFAAAAKADPAAKLYYNDYNIEYTGTKQEAAVGIIEMIRAYGARIDGVGLESHFIVGEVPSQSSIEAAMNSYIAAGATEVAITELDVRFSSLPPTTAGLTQQATDYATVVNACLAVSQCVGMTVWDFTDKYSWIPSTFPGEGDACPYDSTFSKKPAWTAISSALAVANTGTVSATTTMNSSTTTVKTSATTTIKTSVTTTKSSATSSPTSGCTTALYGQCGGTGWTGCTTCASGSTCKVANAYYSQCL